MMISYVASHCVSPKMSLQRQYVERLDVSPSVTSRKRILSARP